MTTRTEDSTPQPAAQRVEKPLIPAWREKEVICLLDTSSSMEWEAADGSSVSRHALVGEALPLFVTALEGEDSAAAAEQAGGSDELGGLLIHGFSNVHTELGDFNSSNFERRWNAIQWGGGTTIMPAWKAAIEDFNEEFGDKAEPPALLALVITDGEATDAAAFAKVLSEKHAGRYFAIAVVANPDHVSVMSFEAVTNPRDLAADLITMAGLAK